MHKDEAIFSMRKTLSADEKERESGTVKFSRGSSSFVDAAEYADDCAVHLSWPFEDLFSAVVPVQAPEAKHDAINSELCILQQFCMILEKSPSAKRMLEEAAAQGWSCALEPLNGPDYQIDTETRILTLNTGGLMLAAITRSEYFGNTTLASLVRGLRDIWQERRHGAFDERYAPDAVLRLERARMADLEVMTVLVAWELRTAEDDSVNNLWRHIIGSDNGDIALEFSRMLERHPASGIHKALKAAFVQWYRDPERINACDHETLDMMDELLLEMPDYNPFGAERLTPVGIEVISCLPDRTAYLQGFGEELLRSPAYAGMDDLINQSHLIQVIHDLNAVRVQNVPFRSAALAARIFPGGQFTPEEQGL